MLGGIPLHSQPPSPPVGVVDCEPDILAAAARVFVVRNRKKPNNFIRSEITLRSYLKYYVENQPRDGRGCPGKWLFELAWQHFVQCGVMIQGVRGDWTFGDNLAKVNHLTGTSQMTLEEAARQTWAYERARQKGFPTVVILDSDGSPGAYRSVDVVFLP
jgi:hypothetical protein